MADDTKISALTAKTTPADNDAVPIYDSVAVETKKTLWSAIKATLLTYFNTVYGTEVVDEAMGGTGTARTIAHTPISGTLKVYDGAVRLHLTTDFTVSGTDITFVVAPDAPYADYRW